MILGVSGTRYQPSKQQLDFLGNAIKHYSITEIHHGDCVGTDYYAHHVAITLGKSVVVHPPDIDKWRAFCSGKGVKILPTRWYTNRNRDIVDCSDYCLALPGSHNRYLARGTYSFIDRAMVSEKQLIIVFPDGEIERINCNDKTPF